MSEVHPFQEMLQKISEALKTELGAAYTSIVDSPDMGLAIAAKISLAVANVASGRMLDRSSARAIKEFQETCMQRVFMAAVSESFRNQALLTTIQAAMACAIEAAQSKTTKE